MNPTVSNDLFDASIQEIIKRMERGTYTLFRAETLDSLRFSFTNFLVEFEEARKTCTMEEFYENLTRYRRFEHAIELASKLSEE